MLSYCLKYRKNTESKNPKVAWKNTLLLKCGRMLIMLLLKCAVCDSKNSKFIKDQEAKGLLSNLMGMKIPFLSDLQISKEIF